MHELNDDALELTIRRQYAAISRNLDSLELWVTNTLSEFRKHNDMVFDVQIRRKDVEKLIKKVRRLQSDDVHITLFDPHVTEHVNDLVGARVIVHVLREVQRSHAMFMAYAPFNFRQITIHYSDDINQSIIDEIKETSLVPPILEKNERGYFCVHYVIEPVLRSEFFHQSENVPYEKFELQLRTLLNHAWAEMHHRAVYKSQLGDTAGESLTNELEKRFADLSSSINNCDRTLDRICRPLFVSPTFKSVDTQNLVELKPYLDEIHSHIREFEDSANPLPPMQRYEKVKAFNEKNKKVIRAYSDVVTVNNVGFNLELAELYLKGYHHEAAYELYLKCAKHTNEDGLVWLRLAETCSGMSALGKDSEVKKYIRLLAEHGRTKKVVEKQESLRYGSAAIIAWEYECLEEAVLLGEISLKGEMDEYSKACVRLSANLVYYKIDYIRSQYPEVVERLEQCIHEVTPLIHRVTDNRSAEHLIAHDYDTIAWYHFCQAEIASAKNDIAKARADLRLAEDYMDKCFELWSTETNNVKRAAEEIARNKARIARLRKALDLKNSRVFISYAHTDHEWLEKLQKHLKPLERQGAIDVWVDTRIQTSEKWSDEIRAALASSKVAVLLVSADYLASEFINEEELPTLLKAAEARDGVRVMPVILSPCRFLETPSLAQFQAVNPPSKPIKGMSEVEQDTVLYKLSKDIENIIFKDKK